MNMFLRKLESQIEGSLFGGKIIMLLWPRQVGKTTLVEKILEKKEWEKKVIRFTGDKLEDQTRVSWENWNMLESNIHGADIIFIDEAQKIPNISNTLKILIDTYKDKKQIIVTWSSSVHLLDLTQEPLTGRKRVFMMFGISAMEIQESFNTLILDRKKTELLIYGSYPAVLSEEWLSEKKEILWELASSNLYRDILEFQQIRNSWVIVKLLKLLALQIGKELSLHRIAKDLGIDMKTVDRYIDLLEKSYIVFRLPPFYRNKRKEISKAHKIYFYDLWIRNAILNNFNTLENRSDLWDIWENFLMIERMKKNSYERSQYNKYFWKSYAQQEIDYIEEIGEEVSAYEYKWKEKKVSIPSGFKKEYWDLTFKVIHSENYLEFIL